MTTLILRKNLSERIKVDKSFDLSADITLQGLFKAPEDILSPVIEIESSQNLSAYNYCEISDFGRKYFMTVSAEGKNRWKLSLDVDVLSSYAEGIRNCEALVKRAAKSGKINYFINDGAFITEQREIILYKYFKINNHPATLGEESFYLMVAGG